MGNLYIIKTRTNYFTNYLIKLSSARMLQDSDVTWTKMFIPLHVFHLSMHNTHPRMEVMHQLV